MPEIRGLTLKKINEITTRINSTQDLHSLLTVIMDTARELLNAEGASLLLYDWSTDELIFDIVRSPRGALLAKRRIAPGQGIAGMCAKSRQPILVNDAKNDERVLKQFDQEAGFETRNIVAVPMMALDRLMGVLETVNSIDPRGFDTTDIRLLTYLSNMAALAIRNRQLYEDLRDRVDELNCIYEISQRIGLKETIDEVLEEILHAIEAVLDVERLSVILKDDNENMRVAKTKGFTVEDHDFRIDPSDGIAAMVFKSGDPLLVRDIEKDLKIPVGNASKYRTKSFISVPILQDGKVIGILNAADKKNGEPFDSFELRVLTTIGTQLADACMRILSRQREVEIQNYKKDLETAAMIQMNSLPEIPSVISGLEIATRYEACKDVGGDFYDLIHHSDDRISFLMADVAGKGVPAALFMEYSKTLLAGQIPRNLDPVTTLTRVNQEVFRKSKLGIFVTCMLIQLEREFGRFRMASAGHNHQILLRQDTGTAESLSGRGTPLGVFDNCEYLEKIVEYRPGDILILYTDGITEAHNSSYEEFGEERLFEIVQKSHASSPRQLIDVIFSEVMKFQAGVEASDDATMMVIKL